MTCPKTGKPCNKPKIYHVTEIINGNPTSLDLCQDCAKDQIGPQEEKSKLLEGVFKILLDFMQQVQPEKEKICPKCGTFLSEVRTTGKLGCSHCHEAFSPELEYFFTPTNKTEETTHTHEELTTKLQNAIKKEDYELAATLRDKIKKL
jgi:protein arginine kinase activator